MKLTKLKELLKSGAVTQEEYDEMSKTAEDDTKADPTDDSPEDEPPEDDPLEDDLETKIAKAVQSAVDRATNKLGNENKLLKDKLEKTRKEKMTAEELRQVELQEKEDELARQQAEIQMEKNRMHAIKALKKAGLDDGSEETLDLVEFVLGKDEPAIDLRVKALQKFAQRVAKNTTDGIYKANGRTPGKGNAGGGKDNPWIKESWNLTKQMELELNDPDLAKTMKASAGI